jgi:hypothetical protein
LAEALQTLFTTVWFDVPLRQGDSCISTEDKAFKQVLGTPPGDTVAMWLKCNSTPPFWGRMVG